MKKNTYLIVTVLTIAVLIGFSYQVMAYLISLKKDPERHPPIIPVRSVMARKVEYGAVKSPVTADGRLVSTQEVVISTEVRGKILEGDIPFKKGQSFRKNDILIRIFDGNAVNSLRARKSAYLQKIAGILPDLKVDYPGSFQDWMNFFKAVDIDNYLPELPEIKTEQEKIFAASRNILTDYYSIKSDEITLEKHTIRSPFKGSFTDVFMEVGAIANPGATLARIIRTDRLELEVPVEVADEKWIEIGDETVVVSENGAVRWKGRVVRKSSFVETGTQSMSVFVSLTQNSENPLYQGQYLKAIFPGRMMDSVMEIPRNAVFNTNEVFIVEDGKLTKRTIDIHKINETTLIISDLPEGTELVVEPLVNAMENSKVEIIR